MAKKRVNKRSDNSVDNDMTTNEENGAENKTSTTLKTVVLLLRLKSKILLTLTVVILHRV